MPLGQVPVAAELAPVKRRRKVFHIVVNSVDEYLLKTTYTNEGFAAEKPSASMVWIECPSGRIDEGWEFAWLDLNLAILYPIHEDPAPRL